MNTSPLAREIELNLIDCCRLCLATSEGTEVEDTARAFRFQSGIRFPLYNGIYGLSLGDDPRPQLQAMLAPFKAAGIPMVTCLGPLTEDPEIAGILKSEGLFKAASLPGMALDLEQLSRSWVDESLLEIVEVRDEEGLRAWVEIQNLCFEFPEDVAEATFRMTRSTVSAGPEHPVTLYLGLLRGQPVATAMSLRRGEVVGVYNITTLPEARRWGFGAAITASPLLDARDQGARTGILHASPAGEPLYRKMGFETICSLDQYLYSPKGLLVGLAVGGLWRKLQLWWRGKARRGKMAALLGHKAAVDGEGGAVDKGGLVAAKP